jgi:hypothetical protein
VSERVDIQFGLVPRWLLETDASDRAVSLYARLAATFADDENTDAWAGLEGMSKITGRSESWVQRGLAELVKLGAVTRKRRIGTSTLTTIHRLPPHMRVDDHGENATSEQGKSDLQTIPRVKPDQVLTNTYTSSSEPSTSKNKLYTAAFEDFWKVYPKTNESKKNAAERFRSAEQRASADEIHAGAERYVAYLAAEQAGGFDRKPMSPARWLREDGWESPWEPPANPTSDLFTDEEKEPILDLMRTYSGAEISEMKKKNQYPYDEETLRRLGE